MKCETDFHCAADACTSSEAVVTKSPACGYDNHYQASSGGRNCFILTSNVAQNVGTPDAANVDNDSGACESQRAVLPELSPGGCDDHYDSTSYSNSLVHSMVPPNDLAQNVRLLGIETPIICNTLLRTQLHTTESYNSHEALGNPFGQSAQLRDQGPSLCTELNINARQTCPTTSAVVSVNRCLQTGNTWLCTICGKSFALSAYVKRHIKNTHVGGQYCTCETCGKTFTLAGSLKRHIRSHTGEKPYDCDICGKSFSQSGTRQEHVRRHTGERPYACIICGQSYIKSSVLRQHILCAHTDDKRYTCDYCCKSFATASNRSAHIRSHTGENFYNCTICGKRFSRLSNLMTHSHIHTDERPFTCDICGILYASVACLRVHIRTHTGERPHGCQVCGRLFRQSAHLTMHMRTHTGERPYGCETCGSMFSDAGNLKRHTAIHTRVIAMNSN